MTATERQSGVGAALLILITFLAYLPALDGGFIWDDDAYVVSNPALNDPDDLNGLKRIWFEIGSTPQYYPMVFSSFWLEQKLFGQEPFGFHLVNICLHLLNALLFVRLLRGLGVPGAWLAGALFAVHPVGVESVAWISERKNLLSTMFYLLALTAYLRCTGVGAGPHSAPLEQSRFRRLGYGGAWLLFVAALLSKSVTATLPFAALLLIWWKRGRLVLRDLILVLPFLAAGALMVARTAWVEAHVVGMAKFELGLSPLDSLAVAGRALWFYLGKLLVPLDLTFIYPRWGLQEFAWWQPVAPLLAIALPLLLYRFRARIGRGPLVATLFFGGTLVPALGFVDFFPMIYSYVADHFQYLAMLGPLALGAALLVRVLGREGAALNNRLWAVSGLLLLALGAQSWRHAHVFESSRALFEDTLQKNPTAVMASINLANAILREGGDLSRSLQLLARAERVDPALSHHSVRAKLEYAIGNTLVAAGKHDQAIAYFTRARQSFPQFLDPVFATGRALALKGDLEGAVAQFELMLKYIPDHEPSQHWLARTREQLGQAGE